MQGTRCRLRSFKVEQEDTAAGRYPRVWSARKGVSVLSCGLQACGMPDLREICREANDICQQTESPEAGRVVSQWRQLIGTGRRKWRDKRVKTEQASKEGKWTVMWVGDYRQKAPAAACDLKKGRKVPVGGSLAWRLPKIERDRDQSRRSQPAPPRRSEGLLPPRLGRSPPLQEGTRQWEGSKTIESDLRTSKQGRTLLSQPSQQDKTWGVQGVLWVPGSRDGCGTGLEATNDSSQWVRREAAGERQGSLAAGSRDRDQAQAQTRRFVVPGPGKSPVVDGGRVGRCWECLRGRTGRCRYRRRRI